MSIASAEPFSGLGNRASRAAGAERRAGRRAVSLSLLLIGVLALVSGVWAMVLPRGSFVVPAHAAAGSVFLLLSLAHVRYNRNAVRLYLQDLGWPRATLRIGIAAAISLALLVPVLRLV